MKITVALYNEPGALYWLLLLFKDAGINLSRISAAAVRGEPEESRFVLEWTD